MANVILWLLVLISVGLLLISGRFGLIGPFPRVEWVSPGGGSDQRSDESRLSTLSPNFTLKHIYHHNTKRGEAHLHGRLDLTPQYMTLLRDSDHFHSLTRAYSLRSNLQNVTRMAKRDPPTVESYLRTARSMGIKAASQLTPAWVREEIVVPNVSDKDTIVNLAYMASNAYVDIPYTGEWTNVSEPWQEHHGLGWMGDGVRGHVFADDTNSTVIIAFKGTSAAIFDGGGDTGPNDKTNDNLLFSCCCARISYLWNTVCDCYTGESYTCNQTCLEEQLSEEDRYYRAALDIYRNVSSMYPMSNIWITGHSLGGALSALLGRTYGVPVVGFQSPPELLPARRLHLPMPPGIPVWEEHIWHFGHTADPVYMGVCNGAGSACWIAGYAFETQCHSGMRCVYDVVADKGWHMSMVNHRIHVVIDDILTQYNDTPKCVPAAPCEDCFNWNFVVPDLPFPTSSMPLTSTQLSPSTPGSSTLVPTQPPQKCLKRTWYGRCYEWGDEPADDEPGDDAPNDPVDSDPDSDSW